MKNNDTVTLVGESRTSFRVSPNLKSAAQTHRDVADRGALSWLMSVIRNLCLRMFARHRGPLGAGDLQRSRIGARGDEVAIASRASDVAGGDQR